MPFDGSTQLPAGYVHDTPVYVADAATITLNPAAGPQGLPLREVRIQVAAARTLNILLAGASDGQKIEVHIKNTTVGNAIVTAGANIDVGGITILTTATLKTDIFTFVFNADINKWLLKVQLQGY